MKLLKYKWCLTFIFCLVVTAAFSLLWIRKQVYWQASAMVTLEKKLVSLENLNRKADLYIAQLQNKQINQFAPVQARQVIWVNQRNTSIELSRVAINN